MPLRLALLVAATAALTLLPGPRALAAPPARTVASHGPQAKGPALRLAFFMNPYGMPCQMQDRILTGMGVELTERAQLVYYKTTEQADIRYFQQYGIRALPTLVVTDANGRELRRATPGIQQMPQVLRLLQP